MVLYKATRNIMNIWPESGHIYYIYMWVLFIATFGASIMIFSELVWFVIGDLKRYNVLDENFTQYDIISDKRYLQLVTDFKLLMIGLFFLIILIIPVSIFLVKDLVKYLYLVIMIFLCGIGIFILILELKKKKTSFNIIKTIIIRIGLWVFICFLTFTFVIVTIITKTALLDVKYNKNGKIIISNESDETFVSLKVQIYDVLDSDNAIIKKDISKADLLFAKETKRLSTKNEGGYEIGTAQLLNGEKLYWNYEYNLDEIKLDPGQYIVIIIVQQDNRSVEIRNMFEINNNTYTYGTDFIEKEY